MHPCRLLIVLSRLAVSPAIIIVSTTTIPGWFLDSYVDIITPLCYTYIADRRKICLPSDYQKKLKFALML